MADLAADPMCSALSHPALFRSCSETGGDLRPRSLRKHELHFWGHNSGEWPGGAQLVEHLFENQKLIWGGV